MSLGNFLRAALAIVLFHSFGLRGAEASLPRQSAASKAEFPQIIEVIPGKLNVKIFVHDIAFNGETIPCWSFLTVGLASEHQKEIIFTLRREKTQKPEDYPRHLTDFFGTVFEYAQGGQLVDVGDSTLLGDDGLEGDKRFRGFGYIEPENFPGVDTGRVPLLAAILLKDDEAEIAWKFGLTRVTSLLGMKYRYYPCPPWSDLERESVAFLREQNKSLLGQMTSIGIQGGFYVERNQIHLTMATSSLHRLQKLLTQLRADSVFALRTPPDRRANSCLVWRPGQTQPTAITSPNSDGSRRTGAFLAFAPQQKENEVRIVEDGVALLLTDATWQSIRQALSSGSMLSIPSFGKDGSLKLDWDRREVYTSPVTGESFFADHWQMYQPQVTPQPTKQRAAVTSSHIVLLSSDREFSERVTVDDLVVYINKIQDAVDAFFTPEDRRTRRALAIQFDLRPDGHEIRIAISPPATEGLGLELHKSLQSVATPKLKGPVKFELVLTIWSADTKQ